MSKRSNSKISEEFSGYGIFIPNFTADIVVNKIKEELSAYTNDNEKLEYLNLVLSFHKYKNHNDEVTLMIKRGDFRNEPILLAQLDAYIPLLNFLKDSISEIQDLKNKKGVTSFVMNEDYFDKITELYEVVKSVELGFISKHTKLSDFTKIFLGLTSYEIHSPVVWMKRQSDLIRLFQSLENRNYIVSPTNFSKTLDLCFDDKNSGNKFLEFYKAVYKTPDSDSRNQKDLDKVLAIF
tara:strand:+ start:70 stop:780 length:711 start_codon:yes stop_codon:yes gene_type:complete